MRQPTRPLPPLELPAIVVDAERRITAAGGVCYLVGGTVRDALLGLPVTDFDLATTLPPGVIVPLFPGAAAVQARLGTIVVAAGPPAVVLAAMREDGAYADRRHPATVEFVTDPGRDALRRDFTVNALYAPPRGGAVVDPLGGLQDLDRRVLRVIGDPTTRLAEDPVRVLRAVRLAAACALQLEPATAAGLMAAAPGVERLGRARVFAELTAAWCGRGAGAAAELAARLGVLARLLPGVQPATVAVLDTVTAPDPILAWSAVLADLEPRAAAELLAGLAAPRRVRRTVEAALEVRAGGRAPADLRAVEVAIAVERARAAAGRADAAAVRRWSGRVRAAAVAADLIDGTDVIAAGVATGPAVGAVLAELRRRFAASPPADRAAALRELGEVVRARIKAPGGSGR